MTRTSLVVRLAYSLLTSAFLTDAAIGGVISRDWKTAGDGLLTYDDVSHREWLDLTQSRFSFFPGTTSAEKYQHIISELNTGGRFSGFSVASGDDVLSFASSAGIDTTTFDYARNITATISLINLVGVSESFSSGFVFSFGVLEDFDTSVRPARRRHGTLRVQSPDEFNSAAGVDVNPSGGDLRTYGNTGVWLYRNQIPEPSSMVILLTCTSLLLRRRM